jgi:hypothetical protein
MVYWYEFVNSPPGFYGKDIGIDALSAIIVILIGIFSLRNFLLDRDNRKHLFVSLAFMILGLSFIVKVLTNLLTHNGFIAQEHFVFMGTDFGVSYAFFSALGFLTHAFLTLFGFYMLYALASKERFTMNYIIIAYFIFISTYFARFNTIVFYLTALIFVMALSRRYILAYKEYGYVNTLYLGWSFGIIGLSQAVFIFATQSRTLYILAEILQLIGYLALLATFIMVLKNARKKDKN